MRPNRDTLTHCSNRAAPLSRQRGAALLMAMVIVTVVATIASSMVWQQWRSVQVETAERGRAQSQWLLLGALDFSRMVLRDDGRQLDKKSGTQVDHLGDQWAQELKEMRLSTFLAVDKDNTDDAPDAFLSGKVADLNARYNLRNLLDPNSRPNAVEVSKAELDNLKRLFSSIKVDPSLADQIAYALEKASLAPMNTNESYTAIGEDAGLAKAPVMPQTIDELTWLVPGLDMGNIERMRPYVTLLPYVKPPQPTPINLNTASAQVIAAVWTHDMSAAERVVRQRQSQYFRDAAEAQAILPSIPFPTGNGILTSVGVVSTFFEVTGTLRLENQIMKQRHMVERKGGGSNQVDVVVLHQERFSGVDSGNTPQ